MKKKYLALAALLFGMVGGSAQASTLNNHFSRVYGNDTLYDYQFAFTLTQAYDVTASAQSSDSYAGRRIGTGFEFTSISHLADESVTLYNADTGIQLDYFTFGGDTFASDGTPLVSPLISSTVSLTAGNYRYVQRAHEISNNPSGFGSILLRVTSSVSSAPQLPPSIPAVPEPESYAMLLAGLGLMGFMIRRSKTS